MSQSSESFAKMIDAVRTGDQQATAELWHLYYQRLVRVAASRLPASLRRSSDEEDVALSAFHSFIAGIQEDKFPDLSGPENLWGLLITLTGRKAHAHFRHQTRQKRGGGQVRGESVFVDANDIRGAGLGGIASEDETADLQAELAEECDSLLNQLPDEQLRQIAIMRMEGFLVDEIATRLELSKRAVERRLQLIRKTWTEAVETEETP
ncbi:ECF-type sigma factor [Roseimaritima multifibrata]|uniref:ECF-type sigma factor n=1 Tax=Roseimaritima multifibrata TaxID=1930274 RepID=UPI001FE4B53C|nr:ECF-type sigma factor [Roseimaritima multifibrata]